MPIPYSNVGFKFDPDNYEEFQAILKVALRECRVIPVKGGNYCLYEPGGGAQLWLHMTDKNELADFFPHFDGKGRVNMLIHRVAKTSAAHDTMSGYLIGDIYTDMGGGEMQMFSPIMVSDRIFNFDPPAEAGDNVLLQVAAFAKDVRCYKTVEEFREADGMGKMSEQLYVPTGFFYPPGTDQNTFEPSPNAQIYGYIREHEVRVNPVGDSFHWMLVESHAGTFDVVADPATITGDCVVNGIAAVSNSWLSGLPVGHWKPNPKETR
jgi:hypothetical protein